MIDVDKNFLKNQLKKYPELKELRTKLLSFGGTEIVPRNEPDLEKIIKKGGIMKGDIKEELLHPSDCHLNAAILSIEKGMKIATGWALSDDGLWRQHSWCVNGDIITETTQKRKIYFGFVLSPQEVENF